MEKLLERNFKNARAFKLYSIFLKNVLLMTVIIVEN